MAEMAAKAQPRHVMGKISRAFFETVIARNLGAKRRDVAVGPANGVDVGVVRLPDGKALISTTDPIYIVPQYGWERAAWFLPHPGVRPDDVGRGPAVRDDGLEPAHGHRRRPDRDDAQGNRP